MNTNAYLNEDNLIFGTQVIGAALLAAGTAAVIGHGLKTKGKELAAHAGNSTRITDVALKGIGTVTQVLGSGLLIGGKTAAYAILIPAYAVGYAGPKWTVMEGIPKGYEVGRDYVAIPLANQTIVAAKFAGTTLVETASLVNEHIVQPGFEEVVDGLKFIAEGVTESYKTGRDYVVVPLANQAIVAANFAGTQIGKTAVVLNEYLVQPGFKGAIVGFKHIAASCKVGCDYVVIPLANQAVVAAKCFSGGR